MSPFPKPGYIYRHHKGELYEVMAVAQTVVSGPLLAEIGRVTQGAVTSLEDAYVVVYKDLSTGRDYARPLSDFAGGVADPEDGETVPRFKWLRSSEPSRLFGGWP